MHLLCAYTEKKEDELEQEAIPVSFNTGIDRVPEGGKLLLATIIGI